MIFDWTFLYAEQQKSIITSVFSSMLTIGILTKEQRNIFLSLFEFAPLLLGISIISVY